MANPFCFVESQKKRGCIPLDPKNFRGFGQTQRSAPTETDIYFTWGEGGELPSILTLNNF